MAVGSGSVADVSNTTQGTATRVVAVTGAEIGGTGAACLFSSGLPGDTLYEDDGVTALYEDDGTTVLEEN
jgi:hypothetical protein